MRIPKVVLDTNVFVSAMILIGHSNILIEKWQSDEFILLFSPAIYDEYLEVIMRPKFKYTEERLRQFSELLTEKGISVNPQIKLNIIKDDPDDNMFLECAIEGSADFIVSGDTHLLTLKKYENIPILKASQFINELGR